MTRGLEGFSRSLLALLFALAPCACAAPAPHPPASVAAPRPTAAPAPARAAADPLATPPAAGAAPDTPFPSIRHEELDNGMELRVVSRKNYPLVELRLVVLSGSASDADQPGVAALAAELLKAGGAGHYSADALAERAESLGTRLEILTERDSTRIEIGVPASDFEHALELVAAVAREPRFAPLEFEKLRQRELERVENAEKGSADWAASMQLYRRLFALDSGVHPYARYDATPSELAKLTLANCKRWYAQNFTPKNAVLVVAGDVDMSVVGSAVRQAFGAWKGERPAPRSYPVPVPASERRVWLIDRPHSAQSEIYVAGLGPERSSPTWPALAAGNQILGGGVAGRLFLDVREKRSLAYHTGSVAEEPAHGPVPLVLSAGTQTAKAGLALQALLDNLQRMTVAAPTAAEVATAVRSLSDSFLFRTETLGDVADLTAKLSVLGLPDDYFDSYRHALAKLDPASVFAVARQYYEMPAPIMVVAGDADVIGPTLSHFGDVVVVDPQHDFRTVRQLPHDEHQPLEIETGPKVGGAPRKD